MDSWSVGDRGSAAQKGRQIVGDVGVYVVPLMAFIAIVVVVTFRPGRIAVELSHHRLGWIEQELGLRGRREVELALRNGHSIQAVAVIRRQTDASLVEARALAESIDRQRT